MNTKVVPVVDEWYQYLGKGQRFKVVAIDEASDVIEIQHFDGDIEEIEFPEWRQLNIEAAQDPENISGAFDVGEIDDLGTEVTDTSQAEWEAPLQEIKPPIDDEQIIEEVERELEQALARIQ